MTKTEKSENGGKDVVLVAVSSLSKQARDALIRMEEAGQLVVESGRKQKSRNGKLNMPDKAIIRII